MKQPTLAGKAQMLGIQELVKEATYESASKSNLTSELQTEIDDEELEDIDDYKKKIAELDA